MITLVVTVGATTLMQQQALAAKGGGGSEFSQVDPTNRKAPPSISGENVYVAW